MDISDWITSFLVVFIESGLLFPLLPGDSLLFTAGLVVAAKSSEVDPFAPLWVLLVTIPIAAFLGDQVGYIFGNRVGHALFTREDSRFFKQSHVRKAHDFFEKYGPRNIVHTYASEVDDPTEDPRFGPVGKQVIEDTGPLTSERMETIDEEILAGAQDFINRATDSGTPFFTWVCPWISLSRG